MRSNGTVDYLLDQLDDAYVSAREMFGGHGIYRDGQMFGIVYEGDVFLKVGADEVKTSDREPFRPRDRQTLWSYRLVGADELEDRAALGELAARAQLAASPDRRSPR